MLLYMIGFYMCLVPLNRSHLKIGLVFVNLGILPLQNLIV